MGSVRRSRFEAPSGRGALVFALVLVTLLLPGLARAKDEDPMPEPRTRVGRRHAELLRRRMQPPSAAAVGDPEGAMAAAPGVDLRPLAVVVTGGNGAPWLQPGETATVEVTLRNFGSQLASGVYGQLNLALPNPYVTIPDRAADWPDIPGQGTAAPSPLSAFQVSVSNVLPCGYPVELSLHVRAEGFAADFPLTLDMERPFDYQVNTTATRFYNQQDVFVNGADANDDFGASMARGDFNADGYEDLLVGAPLGDGSVDATSGAGEAWVVYGNAKGLTPSVSLSDQAVAAGTHVMFGAEPGANLGGAVAMGDVDGDGIDDVITAAPLADASTFTDNGEVYVRYGSLSGATGSVVLSDAVAIIGEFNNDRLGTSLAAADIDGDGFDDVLMGAPGVDTLPSGTDEGSVYVLYGSPNRITSQVNVGGSGGLHVIRRVRGAAAGDALGQAVGAGDVDGDGFEDLLLGVPAGDGRTNGVTDVGVVWLAYGRAERLPSPIPLRLGDPATYGTFVTAWLAGADAQDGLGTSVAAADLDRDGYDDVLAGAPAADGPSGTSVRAGAGEAWVVYGQAAPLASLDLARPPATGVSVLYGADGAFLDSGGAVGRSISAGDANGDGIADVLIGSPGDAFDDRGAAFVVAGRPGRLPAAIDLAASTRPSFVKSYPGKTAAASSGTAVALLDLDGDGLDEAFLGGPNDEPTPGVENGIATGYGGVAHRTYWHKDVSSSYAFVNATTSLPALACDDCSTSIPIGFSFPFYGETFTTAYVSSNGFVSFVPVASLPTASPRCIWSESPTSQSSIPLLLAPFWADLDLRAGGGVHYLLDGTAPNRRLTVEWRDVPHYGSAGTAKFEVSLYESSGQIVFQYADVTFGSPAFDAGASAVVGVQNRTGAQGTNFSCRDATLSAGMALSLNPATPIFEDNMESLATSSGKLGKWTITGAGTHWKSWENGGCTPSYHGRVTSFFTGDFSCTYAGSLVDARLSTPEIPSFPPDGRLTLWQRLRTFDGSDTGRVDVWNGSTATNLSTFSGTVAGGAWHVPGTGGSYFPGVSYASFRFELDTNATGTDLGWMLDDVRVMGCDASGIAAMTDAQAFAEPSIYCRDGLRTGRLDAVGSRCGDGSDPLGYQWLEDGVAIPGATAISYVIPASHPPGVYTFAVIVTCAAGSAVSPGQEVELVAPPQVVGNTLRLEKATAGADVRFTWTNVSGATEYVVYQDLAPGGGFTAETGRAPDGFLGLTAPMPADSLVFYRVAGANPTCGVGPK